MRRSVSHPEHDPQRHSFAQTDPHYFQALDQNIYALIYS